MDTLKRLSNAAVDVGGVPHVRAKDLRAILELPHGVAQQWEAEGWLTGIRVPCEWAADAPNRVMVFYPLSQMEKAVERRKRRTNRMWTKEEWEAVAAMLGNLDSMETAGAKAGRSVHSIKSLMSRMGVTVDDLIRKKGGITLTELAKLAHRERRTVECWATRNKMPVKRGADGHRKRFCTLPEVREWLKGHWEIALGLERGVLARLRLKLVNGRVVNAAMKRKAG